MAATNDIASNVNADADVDVDVDIVDSNISSYSTDTEKAQYIELTEQFYVEKESKRKRKNPRMLVSLNADGFHFQRECERSADACVQLLRYPDIIGSYCGPAVLKTRKGGLTSCRCSLLDFDDDATANAVNAANTDNGGGNNNNNASGDSNAYLYIFAYLKYEKPLRRVPTRRILRFQKFSTYNENIAIAEQWQAAIQRNKSLALLYKNFKYCCTGILGTNDDAARDINKVAVAVAVADADNESGKKKLLIFLNPKSGSCKAREAFQRYVAPILNQAQMQYDLHITTHSNYATEFVRTCADLLQQYVGIIIASGDGLFYETLNGLMQRKDWRLICTALPLGIIPCGTGNGLAKSIAHHTNEPYAPNPYINAALHCVSRTTTPMDIMRVDLAHPTINGEQRSFYSFLTIGWGLIADIDIESERLRLIGANRFTIWALHRLIKLRSNRGRLSYLPLIKDNDNDNDNDKDNDKENFNEVSNSQSQEKFVASEIGVEVFADDAISKNVAEQEGIYNYQNNHVHIGDDDDDDDDDFSAPQRAHNVNSWHSAASKRTTYYSTSSNDNRSLWIDGNGNGKGNGKGNGDGNSNSNSNVNGNADDIIIENATTTTTTASENKSKMPPLGVPLSVEDGWCIEEDDFVLVHAANTTHLAADCYFSPKSRFNDGIIYLVVIRAGISRSALLSFLLGMGNGTHLPKQPDAFIRVLPVRAFRIEPLNKATAGSPSQGRNDGRNKSSSSIMTVDGERIDCAPLQAEIIPGIIKLMARNN